MLVKFLIKVQNFSSIENASANIVCEMAAISSRGDVLK